jgi:tetratricopeptide (TPR) repeat protein
MAVAGFASQRALKQRNPMATYLAAALVAGVISGLFVCFTLSGILYFFATIALLWGVSIPDRAGAIQSSQRTGLLVPAYVLALPALAMFLYFTTRLTVSDLALAHAQRELNGGRIEQAVAAYARSQQWRLAGSSDDLYFSRALAAASRTASNPARSLLALQQAFQMARHATQTSEEQQNAWYNLAGFYAARGDFAGAEACLRLSAAASPNWFKPHWALAQVLLLAGRQSEALAEASRAADLDGAKDQEVAKFLQTVHDSLGSRRTK